MNFQISKESQTRAKQVAIGTIGITIFSLLGYTAYKYYIRKSKKVQSTQEQKDQKEDVVVSSKLEVEL